MTAPAVVAWSAIWAGLTGGSYFAFMGSKWTVAIFTSALSEFVTDQLENTAPPPPDRLLPEYNGALTGSCVAVSGGIL